MWVVSRCALAVHWEGVRRVGSVQEGLWVWWAAVRGERLQRVGGGGLHHQPAVVRSHLPQCPPPVVKAEPGELPDEELQGERVGSWDQEAWWWWQGGLVVRAEGEEHGEVKSRI